MSNRIKKYLDEGQAGYTEKQKKVYNERVADNGAEIHEVKKVGNESNIGKDIRLVLEVLWFGVDPAKADAFPFGTTRPLAEMIQDKDRMLPDAEACVRLRDELVAVLDKYGAQMISSRCGAREHDVIGMLMDIKRLNDQADESRSEAEGA